MEFNWEDFFDVEYGTKLVHCKTKEEALDFINKAKKYNKDFMEQKDYLLKRYDEYKSNTCYSNYSGFGDYEWDIVRTYKCYEWSDYMESESSVNTHWYNKMEF